MEENKYNCDYSVARKHEGAYLAAKILLQVGYVALFIILIAVFWGPLGMAWAGVIMGLAIGFVVIVPIIRPLTWRYVNYDQRYEIFNAGTIRFTRNYGKKIKTDKGDEHASEHNAEKLILEMKIKDFELIAPYSSEEYKKKLDESGARIINHSSSPSAPNVYYGLYTDKNGSKCAILFDMIDKSLGIIEYYNREHTVATKLHFAGEDLGK
ncbi:MAG: hypothetical protein LUH59_00620 [Firmicutes bacterium]|nr:hypothetical protein [Bacillota bacterium]MCD8311553.1 hypothetical protein [Bacillota bacterium]